MMKKYNYLHGMDKYFKELAKVFLELKQEGITYPAESYQCLLNSRFFISDQPSTYVDSLNVIKVMEMLTF